ncbi:MAG: ATP-binding protein [Acidimicrobiales bacterium]
MLATVCSATLVGVEGCLVSVEVHVANGIPGFRVVGLPDASCREARDRARAAIISSGYRWPQRRVTVNLAPSGVRKGGPGLDLAIALGVLAADGQLDPQLLEGTAFVGELGLDGSLRPVAGVLPLVEAAGRLAVVVPLGSLREARLVRSNGLYAAISLRSLLEILHGQADWPLVPGAAADADCAPVPDLADVRGQPLARLALEVAAAGAHHLLLVGPAGAGKTMLASRLVGLLPDLTPAEALEVAKVHSAAGIVTPGAGICLRPPFRSPHHSASAVSLIGGGGARVRPGEISCAHKEAKL